MKKGHIPRILTIIWVVIIFINSLLPGDVSSLQSSYITDLIVRLFSIFSYEPDLVTLNQIIRIVAHFIEFMILGVLLTLNEKHRVHPWYYVFIAIFVVALTDELIQIFTPRRAFQIIDILIDLFGGTVGYLLVTYVLRKPKRDRVLEDGLKT